MRPIAAHTLLSLFLILPAAVAAQETGTVSGEAARKCKVPERPAIPNGRSATEEEMLDAQKKMKAYLAGGEAYLGCLDQLKAGWGEAPTPEQMEIHVLLYNRMVDEMQATGDLFNQSVRAFKGKRGS
jgi:hypothetical protein